MDETVATGCADETVAPDGAEASVEVVTVAIATVSVAGNTSSPW